MKKSRLRGALEDARGGAVVASGTRRGASNNSEGGGNDRQQRNVFPVKASPRPESASLPPYELKQTGDPTSLQAVYFRVRERCTEPKETVSAALSVAQAPIAVQAMRQVVSQMHEASGDVFACPALLRALGMEMEAHPTASGPLEPQQTPPQATEPPCKGAAGWYTLDKVVARGTFGRVYHGHHRLSRSRVAIKTYFRQEGSKVCCSGAVANGGLSNRRDRAQAPQQQRSGNALDWKRVRQEARIMEKLRPHPNVVRYFESFESATCFDLVMELVQGRDLCDHLRHQPGQKLSEKSAKRVFSALCSGVASLHAQNIIHRDLKLENVLLEAQEGGEWRPVLIDFGFSDLEVDAQSAAPAPSPAMDATKNFCGTPSYMAPEVLTCQRYSGKAADVWSLGVILYVLLCGKFPFQGASLQQLHQSARNARQLSFPKSVSTGAQAIVRAVLVADPSRRPSAHQVLDHPWFAATTRADKAESSITTCHCNATLLELPSLEAFTNWEDGREMIWDALADLYGVNQTGLMTGLRDRQLNHVAAFVNVAIAAAGRVFLSMLRELPPHHAGDRDDGASLAGSRVRAKREVEARTPRPIVGALDPAVESTSSHKQQLEQLIGLVKHSLRV